MHTLYGSKQSEHFNLDIFRRMMYYSHVDGDENFTDPRQIHTERKELKQ